MWGFISTETSYQLNFNTGFSTTRSDVLIHLAQWQYWWWFWFAFLWSFYYLLITKTIRFRILKMKPKLSTSFRPHGKWGDFLAAIIPALWCLNILTNSNFILRLIEWQSESNLFIIRIRARQWYWVYKIDLKNFFNVLNVNKNIGQNKWFKGQNIYHQDKLVTILNNKNVNKQSAVFWNNYVSKVVDTNKKLNLLVNLEQKNKSTRRNIFLNKWATIFNLNKSVISVNVLNSYFGFILNKKQRTNSSFKNILEFIFNNNSNKDNNNNNLDYSNRFFDIIESNRSIKRSNGPTLAFRLKKSIIVNNTNNSNNSKNYLLQIKFNDNESYFKNRNNFNENYLVLKQKKYIKKNEMLTLLNKKFFSKNIFLLNNVIFDDLNINTVTLYKLIKKNKKHNEILPISLTKRLLRTKKTLVIPVHLNIALITSSFDIIHSWFVPGLGLKLDCVPGRSTHHTFFIDNTGFYYGQCAEICGRYHHHMPIRICALPFEHFLIWWQNFGLSKLVALETSKNVSVQYSIRKYFW